jgi:mevalonate kinase
VSDEAEPYPAPQASSVRRARSSGKVILLGEHAVVYGVPALAAGIDRGAEAIAHPSSAPRLTLGTRTVTAGDGTDLGRALEALHGALMAPPHAIQLSTTLPLGCGLGGSAALGVACARAVLDALEKSAGAVPPEPAHEPTQRLALVLEGAMAWERVFHGNPSGIDATASALGGCFEYTRERGAMPITLASPLTLAIAVAGPPASTREMVEGVAALKARRPALVQKTLDGVHALVKNARVCLATGDYGSLGQLLDLNQMLLSGLFVSTEEIERACALAREAGALGAKLTGAGGGGSVIALVRDRADSILEAWTRAGFTCFETVVRADARSAFLTRPPTGEGEPGPTEAP